MMMVMRLINNDNDGDNHNEEDYGQVDDNNECKICCKQYLKHSSTVLYDLFNLLVGNILFFIVFG